MRTLVAARSLITLVAVASVATAQTTPDRAADAIFAQWAKPGTAGCALGVLKDGKPLYVQGYGRADIEHSVPITAGTVFHIASLSKQFTAFAIDLLEQEGRLSLDDDIRKYLPELHDFNRTITIRDLLHHTSGLRDQWNLLAMAGWRLEDVITQEDVVNLIWRQRELNFHPNDEFLYSNTGYTLLGLIVQRVSGKPLREFTDERILCTARHAQYSLPRALRGPRRQPRLLIRAPARWAVCLCCALLLDGGAEQSVHDDRRPRALGRKLLYRRSGRERPIAEDANQGAFE